MGKSFYITLRFRRLLHAGREEEREKLVFELVYLSDVTNCGTVSYSDGDFESELGSLEMMRNFLVLFD